MTMFQILSLAVNAFVLGLAVWVIRSGNTDTKESLKATQVELQALLKCLHALELKLGNCVTWDALDRVCSLEEGRITELDHRLDNHDTRIAVLEQKGQQ